MEQNELPIVIIGAGPAGLSAGHEICRHINKHTPTNPPPIILEKLDKVGGIARTETYKGFRFDMGGHRFYTKSPEINTLWQQILGDDFLKRPRLSRIYYQGKFFNYPLKMGNALRGLGIIEGIRILASYLRWQLFPHPQENSFEEWVTNRFGSRLFHTFFKSYTEKVWGISTSDLKAEWAAQRIKDLSLKTAILHTIRAQRGEIKTLIEAFDYPRLGPGMMWERLAQCLREAGSDIRTQCNVVAVHRQEWHITGVTIGTNGQQTKQATHHLISSMPLTELITKLDPPAPANIQFASDQLSYRDFLIVCLILDQPAIFPDNWLYIHDPNVQVGRIQNFKNWSEDMVPDPNQTSLGMEYFCQEGDSLWQMADEDLIALASQELNQIGLGGGVPVVDGCVFRVPKSYPVYDKAYATHLEEIKAYLAGFENLQTIGRNGLHRYNNQDHAMLTGIYAVRNLFGESGVDLWQINGEDYLEEVKISDSQFQ